MNELKEKAEFYLKHKTAVHIELNSKRFYNGLILEVHENFIILFDRILKETPLYFSEIKVMERFKGEGR